LRTSIPGSGWCLAVRHTVTRFRLLESSVVFVRRFNLYYCIRDAAAYQQIVLVIRNLFFRLPFKALKRIVALRTTFPYKSFLVHLVLFLLVYPRLVSLGLCRFRPSAFLARIGIHQL
jgi:hypothetical protein